MMISLLSLQNSGEDATDFPISSTYSKSPISLDGGRGVCQECAAKEPWLLILMRVQGEANNPRPSLKTT